MKTDDSGDSAAAARWDLDGKKNAGVVIDWSSEPACCAFQDSVHEIGIALMIFWQD